MKIGLLPHRRWSPARLSLHAHESSVGARLYHMIASFIALTVGSAPGVLPVGAPTPLALLPVGAQLVGQRSTHEFTAERVSSRPAAFVLRNFLSEAECAAIMAQAEEGGNMHAASTNGATDARKKCDICLLNLQSPVVSGLTREAAELLLDERALAPGSGCEDLHVLRYHAGGEFTLHYDATSAALPRVLTVLYYLNGVGATWFPYANDETRPPSWFGRRDEVMAHAAALDPFGGGDGLLVEPLNAGDALAFFNFVQGEGEAGEDGLGPHPPSLDPYSLHAGLPVREGQTKWLASHFFRAPGLLTSPEGRAA